MDRLYFAEHRGTQILHVDYSGLENPDELLGVVRRASTLVQQYPPGSLLVLVDFTGVPHTLVTAAIMQQGVATSRPHVRARAVVGLTPTADASFDVAARLFASPMQRFDDTEEAKDWLLEQPLRDS